MNSLVRFWRKVDKSGPVPSHRPGLGNCWLWIGSKTEVGYPRFWANGALQLATRFIYSETFTPIPTGLFCCHECDNPSCVRPSHLFLGTNTDNMRDRAAKGRHPNQQKKVCKRGHELSGDNLLPSKRGWRECKLCKRITDQRAAVRRAAQSLLAKSP